MKILGKFRPAVLIKYVIIIALAAKIVSTIAQQHPSKEKLLSVQGAIQAIHTEGHGTAAYITVESHGEISRYYSYFGKVWSEMRNLAIGDNITILAEKNKLAGRYTGEYIKGYKSFYIWELSKSGTVIVKYEDVHNLVAAKEQAINKFVNYFIILSSILAIVLYVIDYAQKKSSQR